MDLNSAITYDELKKIIDYYNDYNNQTIKNSVLSEIFDSIVSNYEICLFLIDLIKNFKIKNNINNIKILYDRNITFHKILTDLKNFTSTIYHGFKIIDSFFVIEFALLYIEDLNEREKTKENYDKFINFINYLYDKLTDEKIEEFSDKNYKKCIKDNKLNEFYNKFYNLF